MPNRDSTIDPLLKRYAFFGSVVAFAGPPVYIHLPLFYAQQHAMSLAVIGSLLLGLRAIDFIQDPVLAWGIARWHRFRARMVVGFSLLLGASMLALFAIQPQLSATAWLILCLIGVFTGFSGLQILFYSTGIALAERTSGGHEQVASWREAGVLAGICLACVAPALFGATGSNDRLAYVLYALSFASLLALAVWIARPVWLLPLAAKHDGSFRALLRDKQIRHLLLLGFVNALPYGMTATLFLFFVEYRLEAATHAGPMLLLFFLSAALMAPVWGVAARLRGTKQILLVGMLLGIFSFGLASLLGSGDWPQFYLICIASGAAISADMTLLPALLAHRVAQLGDSGEPAFGLWGFVNKSTLAVAAGTALPALNYFGFEPNRANTDEALSTLTLMYAVVPCILKLAAVGLLLRLPPHASGHSKQDQ